MPLQWVARVRELFAEEARDEFLDIHDQEELADDSDYEPSADQFTCEHFKDINDTHGHAIGDAVLRAVAAALREDEDTIAVRMGGEEFLLMLRGERTTERAERRRQAIPSRVAKSMPGLDRLVTASMGVLEMAEGDRPADPDAAPPTFANAFARCDALLYEAKAQGRNCMRGDPALPGTRKAPLSGRIWDYTALYHRQGAGSRCMTGPSHI